MTDKTVDIIVVGAGHNQLTTASYLAACGLKVLVLEAHSQPGGGAVTREITLPGFKHDLHATGIVHLQGHPLLKNDELGLKSKHGLKFAYPDSSFMTVFDDGDTLSCYLSLERTCADIARFSQQDAEAYWEFAKWMEKLEPILAMSLGKPPMPFGRFISLLEQSEIGNDLIDIMFRSAYDVCLERFSHPKVQMHFLNWCAEMSVGIEDKTTGITLPLLIGASHSNPAGVAIGGTESISRSMIAVINEHGGEVRFNSHVSKVVNEGGVTRRVILTDGSEISAKHAVIAAIHPHVLGDYVDGLDPKLVSKAKKTENSTHSGVLIHAALNEAPIWKAGDAPNHCACVNMIDYTGMDGFRRVFDNMRYGKLPELFTGYVSTNTLHDPTRAPAGKQTLYFYSYAPLKLGNGGPNAWDDVVGERTEWMMAHLRRYVSNMDDSNILSLKADSPLDMSRHSPSFRNGDVVGLAMYIYQFFARRPTPELAQYRVPGAQGLYLSGPFMHPGGGITGGGRATALTVMKDLGIKYHHVITS